jgi:hypothetical protein
MNLLLVIAPSMAASLVSCLILRYLWARQASRDTHIQWTAPSAPNEVLYVFSHAVYGAGIGVLFWLSWGMPALVQINWWQRGLIFALLNTVILGGVPVLMIRAILKPAPVWILVYLIEVFCTAIAASLAASWAWSRWM